MNEGRKAEEEQIDSRSSVAGKTRVQALISALGDAIRNDGLGAVARGVAVMEPAVVQCSRLGQRTRNALGGSLLTLAGLSPSGDGFGFQ